MNLTENRKFYLLPHIIIAVFVFTLFLFLGTKIPAEDSTATIAELQDTVNQLIDLGPIPLAIIIFMNNAIKCLMAIILGIFIGIPSLIYISVNASIIGILIESCPADSYNILIAGLAPHGIIEISALLISAALGLAIGQEVLKFITRQNSAIKIRLISSLRFYYKWIILMLILAAFIEVFITPNIVSMIGGTGQIIVP